MKSITFAFASIVLVLPLLLSVIAVDKPPTLEYGIISRNNNAPPSTTHPSPVNDPTINRCNPENFCRHFTLSIQNPSGAKLEAIAKVETTNKSSDAGMKAIAYGIGAWTLTKINGSSYGRLSVSVHPTNSTELQAFSQGIATMKLEMEQRSASMSTEDLPLLGKVNITVNTAANEVVLKLFAQVQVLTRTDIKYIMESAKAAIQIV